MDSYEQKDLLLCVEGLGVVVKLESEDGSETVPVFQLGPDALGTLAPFPFINMSPMTDHRSIALLTQ